ncbi:hypothetical protein [Laspinema olomoucense]|uniref:Superfamily II DNA and RNA helicase n=1 Tax=Laspinema olomoucense D3b TaxID=2953688 RepID=A0ABT2N9X4_9CYAN|nr:hypothetical protein [Laspinema sp. D3b]MCT7978066.1 hypothetical protein [Laspinema sp. D3b]
MVFVLCLTTTACTTNTGSSSSSAPNPSASVTPTKMADGRYPVQQASYNDANGEYSLFLLNASPSVYNTDNLPMASLTPEEISAGQKSYLQVESGQASLHLTEDFKIEYMHAVTETQTNPQTGQAETIIVRQESSFWTPFAGAIAGQMVANALFTPHYYVPPIYQPGIVMTGYGGYGSSYQQAVQQYTNRYQSPPAAVKNRQNSLRTTGRVRSNPSNVNRPASGTTNSRPTGSGVGGTNLRRPASNSSGSSTPRRGSFGSGGSSSPTRSAPRRSGGGSRRRR